MRLPAYLPLLLHPVLASKFNFFMRGECHLLHVSRKKRELLKIAANELAATAVMR